MISIPKGAVALLNLAVKENCTPIIAIPANPSAIEKSHQNPEPSGTSPMFNTMRGASTSNR